VTYAVGPDHIPAQRSGKDVFLSENKGTKAMLRYLLHILVVGTIAIIVLAATAFANSAVPSSVTAIDATPKRGLL
jgi:hypothetical protein